MFVAPRSGRGNGDAPLASRHRSDARLTDMPIAEFVGRLRDHGRAHAADPDGATLSGTNVRGAENYSFVGTTINADDTT